MNITGRVAGGVLILIGLGWLVSLFGTTLFGNRTANNLNNPNSTQTFGTTNAQRSPLATNNLNPQTTAGTKQPVTGITNATTGTPASPATTATPQTSPQASPAPAATASPNQEFEQSPRAATPAPSPSPAATIAPTEPVRAGW